MKCINCRCVIPDSSAYCEYCGYPVYQGSEHTYQAPEPDYNKIYVNNCNYYSALYENTRSNYGALPYNDGSDAYDTYYESDYYSPVEYSLRLAKQRKRRDFLQARGKNTEKLDVSKLLVCFVGLDFVIIILLLILILINLI